MNSENNGLGTHVTSALPDARPCLRLVLPIIPPSVNTYTRHANGAHYKTQETLAFERGIDVLAGGQFLIGKKFEVQIDVYFGPKQGRDVDNLAKCVLDGLARNRVFRSAKDGKPLSDSHVDKLTVRKFGNDRKNPRTEIVVREWRKGV